MSFPLAGFPAWRRTIRRPGGVLPMIFLQFASSYPGIAPTSTAGNVFYVDRYGYSPSAATVTSSGGLVFEAPNITCLVTGQQVSGGGILACGAYASTAPAANNWSAAGWTSAGFAAPTLVPGQPAPDGSNTATSILDHNASSLVALYKIATNINGITVFWAPAKSGDAPTSPGVILGQGVGLSKVIVTGSSWVRYVYRAGGNTIGVIPVGGTANGSGTTPSATGGNDYWAFGSIDSSAIGRFDLPPVEGSVGACLVPLDAQGVLEAIRGGDFERTFEWWTRSDRLDLAAGDLYLVCLSTPLGEVSVRWDPVALAFKLKVNGADVLSTGDASSNVNTFNAGQFAREDQPLTVEAWCRASTGECGLRTRVRGCVSASATAVWAGGALAAATAGWLGSNSSGTHNLWGLIRSAPARVTEPSPFCVALGDSIISAHGPFESVMSNVLTPAEVDLGLTIGMLAKAGNTISQQLAAWLASPWRGKAFVRVVYIQVGTNDLGAGADAATVAARIQALIDQVKADNPWALIVVGWITPFGAWVGAPAGASAARTQVNAWISDGTINGIDAVCSAAAASFDDGAGNLLAADNYGDNIHLLGYGNARGVLGQDVRGRFVSLGAL